MYDASMEWRDTNEGVMVVVEGKDEQQPFRLPPVPPAEPSRASTYAIGCAALPFVLVGGCLTTINHRPGLNALGYALIIVVVLASGLLGKRPSAYDVRPSPIVPMPRRASFAIQLEPVGLRMTVGLEELAFVALADIAEIVGTSHVDVVRQDGTRVRLPCPLSPLETEHIASELTRRMRALRAKTADYRGTSI